MNKIFLKSIIFIAYFMNIVCASVSVEKCIINNEEVPLVLNFESEGCIQPPCPLPQGTVTNANITFFIPTDTANCTVDITAKTFGFWVPFNPPDNNVCNFLLNSYCPLDEREIVTYNLKLPILKAYPPISLTLKLTFKDEKNNPIACFQVPAKVIKAKG